MSRTIAALATPPGIGGLAVIRVSGPKAIEISDKVFKSKKSLLNASTHTISYGKVVDGDKLLDTVTASVYKAPNSYTGEDTVEFGCHGGIVVTDEIINLLLSKGALQAEPGEFTKKAFLNGKLDLAQVEAVADLIHSVSVPGSQTAARQLNGEFTTRLSKLRKQLLDIAGLLELELDFSEEDLELIDKDKLINKIGNVIEFCNEVADSYRSSEILRSGFFVGIAGFPNSGKSTLFNALLNRKRAIVSNIPGTTRDYLEEMIYINGLGIKIIDTAGIRDSTKDIIEIEGIKLVESIMEQSNMIIILNDSTQGIEHSDELYDSIKEKYPNTDTFLYQNKTDLSDISLRDKDKAGISALNGEGVNLLKQEIYKVANKSSERISDVLVNQRHATLLKEASSSLKTAQEGVELDMDNEIIAIDIRKATKILGEITGEAWNEEVLAHIFGQFCIGK